MTQTATDIPASIRPIDVLMSLVVAWLAPMFLAVSAGNVDLARIAAIETVNTYRVRDQAGLIAVAQIIAFGLAALASLSQSLDDDISVTLALRLRSNANACNRSAEQNRRVLRETQASVPPPQPAEDDEPVMTEAESLLSLAAAQQLAAEAQSRLATEEPEAPAATAQEPTRAPRSSPQRRNQDMWAIAMVNEAAELQKIIPTLPPAERAHAVMQAGTLSSTAHDLLSGKIVPTMPSLAPPILTDRSRPARR